MTPRRVDRRAARAGFTLLELLLVLGLIVVLAAVAWPALSNPMGNLRLREAARQVRNQVVHARLAALRSGQPHGVWAEPGGRRLAIAPLDDHQSVERIPVAEFLAGTSGAAGAAAPSEAPVTTRYDSREELPEGIVFVGEDFAPPGEGEVPVDAPPPPGRRRLVWPADGAGDDAAFDLRDARGRRILVWVRGMTGGVAIGPAEAVPEVLP